jgi:hypothetical protein
LQAGGLIQRAGGYADAVLIQRFPEQAGAAFTAETTPR